MTNAPFVWLDYTNYRGVREWRQVKPIQTFKSISSFHGGEVQWFLKALTIDRGGQIRDFAIKDIHETKWTDPNATD